jgi:hypothetical protein
MNYCSIQDAWGNNNYISEQYKNYDKQNYENKQPYEDKQTYEDKQPYEDKQNYEKNNLIEHFDTNNSTQSKKLNNSINYNVHNFTCDDYFNHFQSCAKCRNKFKNNISTDVIHKLKSIFYNNKDNIILLLLILFFVILIKFILLFFK